MEKLSKYYLEILKLLAEGEKDTNQLLLNNYKSSLIDMKKTLNAYLNRYEELSFQEWLKVDRLKSLVNQINIILDNTYKNNEALIINHAKESYSKAYNGLFYQLEIENGLTLDFTMIDTKTVEKAIQMPIDGLRLSERLYDKHLHNLKLKTKGALTRGLINGSGYRDIAADISNIGVADYKQALRIAITEGNRLRSLAREDSYQEASKLGIDLKKRWISTLDHKTRDTHRALDGVTIGIDEEFEIRGYKALQPRLFGVASEDIYCRCDTLVIVEDIDPKLRRDNFNGDVIDYKSYNEWYQDKIEKYGEKKVKILDKMERNKSSDKKQHERYIKKLGKLIPEDFTTFQNLKYNDKKAWDRISYKYKLETIYNLDRLKHTENFANKKVIKHILEGEVNRNNPKRIKAVGFHMENMLTKKGEIIEETRSNIDKNGVYSAKVIIDGVPKIAKSTFFPTDMTPQHIVNAINEAYENKRMIKRFKYVGDTSYGFQISMYLDKDNKITTAYPIMKEGNKYYEI